MAEPTNFLPLKPLDLHLLLALQEGERHGYALVQAIDAATQGVVRLEPGNLYRVLRRLLADGLVAESERRATGSADDERRRYYRLTSLGARVAAEELRRLHALVSSAPARALTRRWAT